PLARMPRRSCEATISTSGLYWTSPNGRKKPCTAQGGWASPWPRAVRCDDGAMRLRLYHHRDGARVAYRETGAGPGIALLHSLGLSHREWEPIVVPLAERFRVVLPDLPLHGDSEDRPRHPYTLDWLTEVIAGFV